MERQIERLVLYALEGHGEKNLETQEVERGQPRIGALEARVQFDRLLVKFLDRIETNAPDDLDIHIVMDNYVTHKTKTIRDWFAKRPRWHVHFTPTSASWLNQVERFFALLTEKQPRRGVHRSTQELELAILDYVNTTNDNPKPFKWTKSADDILAAIQRFCLGTLETAEQQTKIHQTSESGH